jgi:hypothetical protein
LLLGDIAPAAVVHAVVAELVVDDARSDILVAPVVGRGRGGGRAARKAHSNEGEAGAGGGEVFHRWVGTCRGGGRWDQRSVEQRCAGALGALAGRRGVSRGRMTCARV